MMSSRCSIPVSASIPCHTVCATSNDGCTSKVRAVQMPSTPKLGSTPAKSAWLRSMPSNSPSAVTISTADTAAAKQRARSPEPWVPVEQAPATEICGREPMVCSAKPAASKGGATWANVIPAAMVTLGVPVAGSALISNRCGRFMTEIKEPLVSATGVKEWPVPTACTWDDAATSCCTSITLLGANTAEAKVTLPAQFVCRSSPCFGSMRTGRALIAVCLSLYL